MFRREMCSKARISLQATGNEFAANQPQRAERPIPTKPVTFGRLTRCSLTTGASKNARDANPKYEELAAEAVED